MDAYEKLFIKMETEKKYFEGMDVDESKKVGKVQERRKPSDRMRVAKKLLAKMKVLKVVDGKSAGRIIPVGGNGKGLLGGHILVVNNKLTGNGYKEDLLTAIKDTGIDYVVAPDFEEKLYEIAARVKLCLIKCGDPNLIEQGDELEVHLKDGFLLNVDTGLRNHIVPHVFH